MRNNKSLLTAAAIALVGVVAVASVSFADYETEEGNIKVKVKALNANGRYAKVSKAKTYLLSKDGDTVRKSKTANTSGTATYKDLTDGNKYRVACKKTGYVSAKNKAKNRYVSDKITVKAGKTKTGACYLAK